MADTKTSAKIAKQRDFWAVRVDGDGNQLWDQSYQNFHVPNAYETVMASLDQTADGGFIFAGTFTLPDGGQFPEHFWAVRTDRSGTQIWDHLLPGGLRFCYAIKSLGDGGFLLGGADFIQYRASRLDENGSILWEQLYTGSGGGDELLSLSQTADGGFVLGGWSTSRVGRDKTVPNYGSRDLWVIKLAPEDPRLQAASRLFNEPRNFRFSLFPGETNHSYRIDFSTNLLEWTAFQTNRPRSYRVEISDTNDSRRFYRTVRLL